MLSPVVDFFGTARQDRAAHPRQHPAPDSLMLAVVILSLVASAHQSCLSVTTIGAAFTFFLQ
jgi:hypothetical protein